MPDFEHADIYPRGLMIEITDLPRILHTIHENELKVRLPVDPSSDRHRDLMLTFSKARKDAEDRTNQLIFPHETRSTLAELIIAAELQRRVGILLRGAANFDVYPQENSSEFYLNLATGTVAIYPAYVKQILNLGDSLPNLTGWFAEFETLAIELNSPIRLISRLISLRCDPPTLQQAAPATERPAARPGICLATAISIIAATSGGISAGYSIRTYEAGEENLMSQIENNNFNTLVSALSRDDAMPLEICLNGINPEYYNHNLVHNTNKHVQDGVAAFAGDYQISWNHNIKDPKLLRKLAHVAATRNVRCFNG